MPALLSDISFCTHDLGRILYCSPKEWNVSMQIDSTDYVSSFISSHTIYHLSFLAVPSNSMAKDARSFEMWTRFRDVRCLWEKLGDVHKKLQLRGTYPQFANGVIFGNKSAGVIGERMTSITTFLNYVLSNPVLRQSSALQDYLVDAKEVFKHLDNTAPLMAEKTILVQKEPEKKDKSLNPTDASPTTSFSEEVISSDFTPPVAHENGNTTFVTASPVERDTVHTVDRYSGNSAPAVEQNVVKADVSPAPTKSIFTLGHSSEPSEEVSWKDHIPPQLGFRF